MKSNLSQLLRTQPGAAVPEVKLVKSSACQRTVPMLDHERCLVGPRNRTAVGKIQARGTGWKRNRGISGMCAAQSQFSQSLSPGVRLPISTCQRQQPGAAESASAMMENRSAIHLNILD